MIDILLELNGVKLTAREIDVVACIVSGHSWKAIAELLGISVETLHSHIKHIKYKTECFSKDSLICAAELSPGYRILKKRYDVLVKSKKSRVRAEKQRAAV